MINNEDDNGLGEPFNDFDEKKSNFSRQTLTNWDLK